MINDQRFQTITAIAIVIITAAWLIWRAWMKRKTPGCGDGCGCPTDDFKKKLAKKK